MFLDEKGMDKEEMVSKIFSFQMIPDSNLGPGKKSLDKTRKRDHKNDTNYKCCH